MFTNNILAEEIIGIPRIIDGDTVHINNFKIRLEGIDAPEIKQKCKKEKLKISSTLGYTFFEDYNCGKNANEKLKAKVNDSNIKCISSCTDDFTSRVCIAGFSSCFSLLPIGPASKI